MYFVKYKTFISKYKHNYQNQLKKDKSDDQIIKLLYNFNNNLYFTIIININKMCLKLNSKIINKISFLFFYF